MLVRRFIPAFSLGLLLAALGAACESEADPCASCDAESEYCVTQGSDVQGVPSTRSCTEFPPACADTPTCDCLASVDDSEANVDFSLSFCVEQGCSVEDGVVAITCPGG